MVAATAPLNYNSGTQTVTITIPSSGILTGAGSNTFGTAVAGTDYVIPTGVGSALAVTSTGSSTSRTLASRFAEVFNVLDYGAVGDGSTDNATAFAAVATAVNATSSTYPTPVYFPPGTYLYTSGLTFTVPVELYGTTGSILNYTGTDKAMKLGPDGLTSGDSGSDRYHLLYMVRDLTLTGGGSMTYGIYVNNFVTIPHLFNVYFHNFGNASAAGVWFNGDNWDAHLSNCQFYSDSSTALNWVWVGQENLNSTRLRIYNCLGTEVGTGRGYGIRFNGQANEIANSKIEGFSPALIVGPLASGLVVDGVYFENLSNNDLIQYGQEPANSTNLGNYIPNLTISNCYADLHNGDLGYTGAMLGPRNTSTGLQGLLLDGNTITGMGTGMTLVNLNTSNSGQSGCAVNNQGVTGSYSAAYVGFWQSNTVDEINVTANSLGGAYVNISAAKNQTGGSGGAAAVRFYDQTTLAFQFICTLGNSEGSRYGGFQANVDRDGNKLPLWFFTQDSAGNLQVGLKIDCNQTPGQGGALEGNFINLNGSNISTGTVADARLTSNVPLLASANTFTGGLQQVTPSGSGASIQLNQLGSGTTNGTYWAYSVVSNGNTLLLGASSSTYSTGGILTWIGNNQPFLYYPSSFKIGTGTGSTAALAFSGLAATFGSTVAATSFSGSGTSLTGVALLASANTFTAEQQITPSGSGAALQINQVGAGTGNNTYWAYSVQAQGGSNELLLGYSSSTYSTGGLLTWIGNSNAFLYYPSNFNIGTGTGGTPALAFVGLAATFGSTVTATSFSGSGTSLTGVGLLASANAFTNTNTFAGLTTHFAGANLGHSYSSPNAAHVLTSVLMPRIPDFNTNTIQDYQDEFCYADKRVASWSITPTPDGTTGSDGTATLFRDDSNYCYWNSGDSAAFPIVITMDWTGNTIAVNNNGYYMVGLTTRFTGSQVTTVQIETWNSGTSAYQTMYGPTTATFVNDFWLSPEFNPNGNTPQKIRITIQGTNPVPTGGFNLERVLLYHGSAVWDPWHLHIKGGTLYGSVTLTDTVNLVLGTTTGTQLGTSAAQKLGLWGVTPVVQPSSANEAALTDSTTGTASGTVGDVGSSFNQATLNNIHASILRLLNQLRNDLTAIGAIKGSS